MLAASHLLSILIRLVPGFTIRTLTSRQLLLLSVCRRIVIMSRRTPASKEPPEVVLTDTPSLSRWLLTLFWASHNRSSSRGPSPNEHEISHPTELRSPTLWLEGTRHFLLFQDQGAGKVDYGYRRCRDDPGSPERWFVTPASVMRRLDHNCCGNQENCFGYSVCHDNIS
ncbi:hypothetical protein N658DRAFT_40424 [Parathielavia hyrcaniae]|uniref:Uncharacterized protein n=1 Tax=Parathielavia hyrcaniae TaxID=113614 RepID=A0AAN6Q1I8_9PEZI|nr:hypothetical protein N658DRAFT_40424 [Parathielavia hyrcaniae]